MGVEIDVLHGKKMLYVVIILIFSYIYFRKWNNISPAIQIDGITTIATDMAVPMICYIAEKMNLTSNS